MLTMTNSSDKLISVAVIIIKFHLVFHKCAKFHFTAFIYFFSRHSVWAKYYCIFIIGEQQSKEVCEWCIKCTLCWLLMLSYMKALLYHTVRNGTEVAIFDSTVIWYGNTKSTAAVLHGTSSWRPKSHTMHTIWATAFETIGCCWFCYTTKQTYPRPLLYV